VELTVAEFDQKLVPTYRVLESVHGTLLLLPEGALDDALAGLGVERDALLRLQRRSAKHAVYGDVHADYLELKVFTFLLHAATRDEPRARFEVAAFRMLADEGMPSYVAPFGVLAVASFRVRQLFFPVAAPRRTSVVRAYDGLVRHLRALREEDATELVCTAILWRIAAIVDGLVPGEVPLYDKMNAVRGRVVQSKALSEQEKRLWNPLQKAFANRRHALCHLIVRDGESFETASAYAMTSLNELRTVSTALGFAILQAVADDLEQLPPPIEAWEWTWSNTAWIEEQL